MKYYFIRVNGPTVHDNPNNPECYVGKEPEEFKRKGYSNYLEYCFRENIVRMGWPAFGDLNNQQWRTTPNCYHLPSNHYIHAYLEGFKNIEIGSVLLVPNRDHSGEIYLCEVIRPYWYDSVGPYECSHRVGVRWDRDGNKRPICYSSEKLKISKGGWWLRAFHMIDNPKLMMKIESIRTDYYPQYKR